MSRREPSLQENLAALGRAQWFQFALTCLIGLGIGALYYFGFIFQLSGGWR